MRRIIFFFEFLISPGPELQAKCFNVKFSYWLEIDFPVLSMTFYKNKFYQTITFCTFFTKIMLMYLERKNIYIFEGEKHGGVLGTLFYWRNSWQHSLWLLFITFRYSMTGSLLRRAIARRPRPDDPTPQNVVPVRCRRLQSKINSQKNLTWKIWDYDFF